MPTSPVIQIADRMAKRKAGYGLDECSTRKEVMRVRIPILLIHRGRDTFVSCSVVYELCGACASLKELLIMPGTSCAGACCKDTNRCERAIEELIARVFGKEENRA